MASLLLAAIFAQQVRGSGFISVAPYMVIGLLEAIGLLTFWTLGPSERQVRRAGDKYAEQILYAAAALEAGPAGGAEHSSGKK